MGGYAHGQRELNAPPMLIYLHGFNSSPASSKAQLLQARPGANDFLAPALPPAPAAAASLLRRLASEHPQAALIGSSLGGYYATWLAESYGLRAVLLNPAVRPYDLLANEVGVQTNFHTGEQYQFTLQHLAELRALEVDAITPERYLLMVETGDEVLDYRDAVARYQGARQHVIEGGDHGFSDFSDYIGLVLQFCGVPDSVESQR
jgi:predicted esterase YcpF (UPF0227 family)